MEAKELRIGNYVDVLENIDQIKSIGSNESGEYATFNKIYNGYYLIHEGEELIKPIPLTEEYLLKFGFTNYENESWFWSFDFNDKQETFKVFALTAGGVPMGLWGIVGCPQLVKKIEFVHQLQNLYFALTGEELTLKN